MVYNYVFILLCGVNQILLYFKNIKTTTQKNYLSFSCNNQYKFNNISDKPYAGSLHSHNLPP